MECEYAFRCIYSVESEPETLLYTILYAKSRKEAEQKLIERNDNPILIKSIMVV
nr:MAG TPA: hypothetical protein [Caudoviricetes sp.]